MPYEYQSGMVDDAHPSEILVSVYIKGILSIVHIIRCQFVMKSELDLTPKLCVRCFVNPSESLCSVAIGF